MNIKEQESQLRLNLNLEIYSLTILWIIFWVFIGYRLWSFGQLPEAPLAIGENVPTIKQGNLEILRSSIKSVSGSNLPVVRMEPFD
ncbi:TPA: hypothetical protein DIU27_02290 [Candidatus Collierbacteria bacterium]|uniref:Uncharacterized protein n=1 Tax=Candidatus Collierbacteria bacterium GW2011_GWB2_44_22 TaxID=1618387 RepID=A0A0G1HZI4_9BACT|nr:MAG: hypothetical protein UW31_C0009G0050 [Candidatus Collierbacteria bacterium GW2011_GWA2_44_13]KKT51197.1 MAG: hypothetical protein UW42_C0005G0005 [Candidatus Collierbacteria bacterium GW2011_GWB1_44_197]KKT51978.1 MAG: hypothetical protein UW44_C0005G0020 [Candidatus Collierbacteria bacterium GW2011_GWB2_44_22]KKT62274.1 MAG: hypothetical protein UW56_C0009G0048 [Candidatus Collierbacteria bacterium GW2011_GWD1_44_27]KKT66620.1 MAG: hypothetical protein UW58_C0005G0016 [Candidatus Colli